MAALAAGTGAIVVVGIYVGTAAGIERHSRRAVRAELERLVQSWRAGGLDGLIAEVERRSEAPEPREFAYLLTDAQHIRVTGNIREWPETYAGEGPGDEIPVDWREANVWTRREVQLEAVRLDRNHLLVGRDEARDAGLLRTLQASALGGFLLAALVAIGAGLGVSRNLLGRVEQMREKIDEILGGAPNERVAVGPRGDEFDDLAARFNRLLDENRRLLEQVRETTNNIAHDLRTPLSRMHTRLEAALAAGAPIGDPRATLEALSADTDRLLDTFNGLLQIARVEDQELRRGLQPIDLKPLIEDIVDLYGPLAEEAGLVLESDLEAPLAVPADRQLLGQALANLVDNAIKYAPGGNTIEIAGRRRAWGVELSVADQGPGIPEADRTRVLGRLVRLDDSRAVPGTGLGLSFVVAVAGLHGGEVRLEDNAPGLRVILRLEGTEAPLGGEAVASTVASEPT